MCLQCDGYSEEEAMRALDLQIRIYGWAYVSVTDDAFDFCYTVGLLEHYGYPELVLLDVDAELHGEILHEIVRSIVQTGELDHTELDELGIEVLDIHPDHLDGALFGRWVVRYGRRPRPGEMLQILLPKLACPECHASRRRLDRPGPLPPPPGTAQAPRAPNRSERRRKGRGLRG